MLNRFHQDNVWKNSSYLELLLSANAYLFNGELHATIPEEPGIYIISNLENDILRAGSTKRGNNLRQRIYRNHFMGDQKGNIRKQLVDAKICQDLDDAKLYLKQKCKVRWLIITDDADRKWAEHFMLSVIQPKFSD